MCLLLKLRSGPHSTAFYLYYILQIGHFLNLTLLPLLNGDGRSLPTTILDSRCYSTSIPNLLQLKRRLQSCETTISILIPNYGKMLLYSSICIYFFCIIHFRLKIHAASFRVPFKPRK